MAGVFLWPAPMTIQTLAIIKNEYSIIAFTALVLSIEFNRGKQNFTPASKFITFITEPAHLEKIDHNIDFSAPFFLSIWLSVHILNAASQN